MDESARASDLPFTGERFIPGIVGDIELEHMHRYIVARQLARGKVVLDIACGEGYGAAMLAETAALVHGVDIAADVIEHAEKKYQRSNVIFHVGSCARIPIADRSIDLVVSFETIEHHNQHEEMLAEIKRVLRPDGVLLLSSPDVDIYSNGNGSHNPFHVKELSVSELKDLLGRRFTNVRIFGQKLAYGSIIVPESGTANWTTFDDGPMGVEGRSGVPRAVYAIGVASDRQLPELPSGIYERPECSSGYARQLGLEASELKQRFSEQERDLVASREELKQAQADACRAVSDYQRLMAAHAAMEARVAEVTEIAQQVLERMNQLQSCVQEQESQTAAICQSLQVVDEQVRRLTEPPSVDGKRSVSDVRNMAGLKRWWLRVRATLRKKRSAFRHKIESMIPGYALRNYFAKRWYRKQYGFRRRRRYFPRIYQFTRGWKKGMSPHPLFDVAWYRSAYPDVAAANVEPVSHYVEFGWKEGRQPHPLFDTAWYLEQNPDVAQAGIEPLWHYINHGWKEGRSPHVAFDTVGYLHENPDVAAAKIEPLTHYLTHGWKEGRRPHPLFDPNAYLNEYLDVAMAGMEPLTHFISRGWMDRREPGPAFSLVAYLTVHPEVAVFGVNPFIHFLKTEGASCRGNEQAMRAAAAPYAPPPNVERRQPAVVPEATDHSAGVQAIAMYLPQFHRIPENDRWWGEGFTEWTNVRRGKPMFEGHYQPHVPHPDVGYYDLTEEGVLERQAAMARRYGIHGFCFYYYWFNGRRVLEKPLDVMLRSGKPDFPFCFCWANENWTRRWDGKDHDILLAQEYSPENDVRFITELLPALRDPRYIRIEGRPLLVVYRPGLLTDPAATAKRWRIACREQGLGEIHLAAVHSFDKRNPTEYGFDSAIQFPPLQIPAKNLVGTQTLRTDPSFVGGVLDYREAVRHTLREEPKNYTLFRGVMPGWDNTARRMEKSTLWVNSSPEQYGRWLEAAVQQTRLELPPGKRFIFINAWNEWAEGAHLEPDVQHEYAFLEETARALGVNAAGESGMNETKRRHRTVIQQRQARAQSLFEGDSIPSEFGFLFDYVPLLAQLSKAGYTLAMRDGVPECWREGERHQLRSRQHLAAVEVRLRPRSRRAPFCFVLLQYNKPEVTARCILSLERLVSDERPIQIVVVDNKSSPEAVQRTREMFADKPHVTVLYNDENLGFARGNNVGYSYARDVLGAEFIAVLNNDTVIQDPAFIEKVLALYEKWNYSILGPDIVTPDGRHENPWNDYVYSTEEWQRLLALYGRERQKYLDSGRAEFRKLGTSSPQAHIVVNPILQGAAFVASPTFVRERPRLFDERTFLYGEEFLLATECLLSGNLMLYSSEVAVVHEEGVTTASLQVGQKVMHGYDNAIKAIAISEARLRRQAAALRGEPIEMNSAELDVLLGDGDRHVLVDLFFCQPGFHGGGEYGKAVFKGLVESTAKRGDVTIWVALDPGLFIDEWIWELCRRYAVNVIRVKCYDDIVALVDSDKFTTFFAPAIVVYTGYEYMKKVGGPLKFKSKKTRLVGTLLDVRDLELAENWEAIAGARRSAGCKKEARLGPVEWKRHVAHSRQHAEALRSMYVGICNDPRITTLVTISKYAARSIMQRVGRPAMPLVVAVAPEKPRPSPAAFVHEGIDFARDPFALLLNAGREEKNAVSAVNAFVRLFDDPTFRDRYPGLKVVLGGIAHIDDLGLPHIPHAERFVPIPHLATERLEYLMQQALCLVYPSFNEGFGLPPVEAMRYGTPSVIANNTSIPEICGDAAVSCDPFDIASVVAGIRQVLETPPAQELLRCQADRIARKQAQDLGRVVDIVCDRMREECDFRASCEEDERHPALESGTTCEVLRSDSATGYVLIGPQKQVTPQSCAAECDR